MLSSRRRKEGRVEKKAHAACPRGPGLESRTYRVLGKGPQLHATGVVHNSAAHLVVGAKRSDHITPILNNLHWLPIRKCILFKLLLIVYKSLNNLAPAYITELISPYESSRVLRSCSKGLLQVPREVRSAKVNYGSRAFFIAAPTEWNNLPEHIKRASTVQSFKNCWKLNFLKYSCAILCVVLFRFSIITLAGHVILASGFIDNLYLYFNVFLNV